MTIPMLATPMIAIPTQELRTALVCRDLLSLPENRTGTMH